MDNKYLEAKHEWALSDEGRNLVTTLVEQGIDFDLAVNAAQAFLGEKLWQIEE